MRLVQILIRWGATPAAAAAAAATRYPNDVGLIDELGELTFHHIHRRSNALANALADRGVGEGDGIAILARNHRYFVEATIACSKLGARALYLNTSFAAPQAREVLDFFEVGHLADRAMTELSSGEARRVVFARALSRMP